MRPLFIVCALITCALFSLTATATEIPAPMLNAMGLSGIQTLTDAQGQEIRGTFVANVAYIYAGQQAQVNATQTIKVPNGKLTVANVAYVDAGKQAKVNTNQTVVVKGRGSVTAINFASISTGTAAKGQRQPVDPCRPVNAHQTPQVSCGVYLLLWSHHAN